MDFREILAKLRFKPVKVLNGSTLLKRQRIGCHVFSAMNDEISLMIATNS